MSAATSSLRYLLARAAIRSDALMHVVSQRDTGLLNPICAAHPIRSAKIDTWTQVPADLTALCADCAALATSIPGITSIQIGLAVFLGGSSDGSPVALLTEVPTSQIDLASDHARSTPGDSDDLIASITERGIVTPVTLRRVGDRFQVIDGARRLYAAHKAGRGTVPAIIRDTTDSDALLDALVANLHRADLNPIDQANAYQRALETLGCSKAELGRRLGISREQVSNTIRLLGLPEDEQDRIAAGELTVREARARLSRAARPTDEQLLELSRLVADLLTVRKVQVKPVASGKQITITVADKDLARVLAQFGAAA